MSDTVNPKPSIDWHKGMIDWHLPGSLEKTTFLVVGDILLEGSFLGLVEEVIKARGGNFVFSHMQSILQSADIVMGNLENPLSDRGAPVYKIGPNFRASPKMAKILRKAGFTVLGVANNHTRDYGNLAFIDTLTSLRKEGILPVGGGRDTFSASRPLIIKKHNASIGILAFTYRQESIARRKQPGAADLDNPECYRSVKSLSEEVDLTIVYLHINGEYSNYPVPHRLKAARRFIDMGAEMVIGHHPHVPQGIELYKGKLIAFSLGNFIFYTMRRRPLTSLGYVIKAELTRKGTASVAVIPYRISDCYDHAHALCQPVPLSGTSYQDAMAHLEHISAGLNDARLLRINWEQMASKDMMLISKHILEGIMRKKDYSLWSSQLTLLRHSCPAFFKRLFTGKLLGDIKTFQRESSETRILNH